MKKDYRKLCLEIFGTDNIEELKQIAKKAGNNRNAGRKPKFTAGQIAEIEGELQKGVTINEAAKRHGTSRQIIDKYVNRPPQGSYTLRMTYMYENHPCTVIDVDFLHEKVAVKNRTGDILHRAFGAVENPTWQQFTEFLKERCFPETRGDKKAVLKELGLDSYDPLRIVEKTRGKTADDNLWLKFKYYPQRGEGNANN